MATAEAMREHRRRIRDGEYVPPEPVALPVQVPMSDDARAEMERAWLVEYRKVMAAWLIRQRSPHTQRAYRRGWSKWVAWCNDHGIDPVDAPSGTGGVWLAELEGAGAASASRHQYRVAVSQALLELSAEGLRSGCDPFARVPSVRVSKESTLIPLGDDEMHRALEVAATLGGQHLTAILLCSVMGLRAFEAGQVTSEGIERSPWGPVVRIIGKGGLPALVPVPQIVLDAAKLDGFPMDGRKGKKGATAKHGYSRIAWLTKQVSDAMGVHLSPHMFRHWHVTAALEAGVPLERVQDSVRHADPATTQRYNRSRRKMVDHSAHVVAGLPAVVGTVPNNEGEQ